MDNLNIKVRKGNGEFALFDLNKFRRGLRNSGASAEEISAVEDKLRFQIHDGISTSKLFRIAYSLLRKKSNHAAGRYKLKKAILELGPTGYPFEKFIARLFESDGYKAESGVIVQGKCVQHEVDVVAEKGEKKYMVECKYHRDSKGRSDVKVALYIKSRFDDVSAQWAETDSKKYIYKGMIVTNTRFTDDATKFGTCAGLKVVSWDYPKGNSLKDWIDRSGYHPITSLASLRKAEKQFLLEKGIVLCRELASDFNSLIPLHLTNNRFNTIKKECLELMNERS